MTYQLLICALAVGLLWITADWIVDSAAAIARSRGVSELTIGLTIVAFGTSAPEFLVTATAAVKGLSDISMANAVGSNFVNLGLILGAGALIRPVAAARALVMRDGLLLLVLSAAVALAAWTGFLGRPAGLLLLGFLCWYLWLLLRSGGVEEEDGERRASWWDYPRLLAGFAGVALGGSLLVESATTLARAAGVSEWFIGMTLVALGTSLPELATTIAASLKGRNDMLLGNLVGSNIFNYAGVLGTACVLRPLSPSPAAALDATLNVAFVALFLFFARTHWRIGRREGLALIAANLLVVARSAFG